MMGHLNNCRRQVLPIVTKHFLFSWSLDIASQQDALLAVIYFDYTRAIIPLLRINLEWPVRGEVKSLPLPRFTTYTGKMTLPSEWTSDPHFWPDF